MILLVDKRLGQQLSYRGTLEIIPKERYNIKRYGGNNDYYGKL